MDHQSKLPNLETTIFSIMSALANEHNAINLSQGFPDFSGDPKLIELVNMYMTKGFNQYAPMPGVIQLREAIANKYDALYGSTYHPANEITITNGATQAIFSAITAFIGQGDEVIVFRPAYDSYIPTIELNGGIPISIQLHKPDFKINWEEVKNAITEKTKMIVINTPHNPVGAIFTKEDMLMVDFGLLITIRNHSLSYFIMTDCCYLLMLNM